jgi:hypothetical protein
MGQLVLSKGLERMGIWLRPCNHQELGSSSLYLPYVPRLETEDKENTV